MNADLKSDEALRYVLQTWKVQPRELTVKVNGLEITSSKGAFFPSSIKVNGVELAVKEITLHGAVDAPWEAVVTFFPRLEVK